MKGAYRSGSAEETQALAARLAATLEGGEIIALEGELGAGKTAFTKGLAAALGIVDAARVVISPTFVLHRQYDGGRLRLDHVDAYRLGGPEELEWLGLLDDHDRRSVLVVEWFELVADALPAPDYRVQMAHAGGDQRQIVIG